MVFRLILLFILFSKFLFAIDYFSEKYSDSVLLNEDKYYEFEKHWKNVNLKTFSAQIYFASIWNLIDKGKLSKEFLNKLKLSPYTINSYILILKSRADYVLGVKFILMQGFLYNNPIYKYNEIYSLLLKNGNDSLTIFYVEKLSKLDDSGATRTYIFNIFDKILSLPNGFFGSFLKGKRLYNEARLLYYYKKNYKLVPIVVADYNSEYSKVIDYIIKQSVQDSRDMNYINSIITNCKDYKPSDNIKLLIKVKQRDMEWLEKSYENLNYAKKSFVLENIWDTLQDSLRIKYLNNLDYRSCSKNLRKLIFPYYIEKKDSLENFLTYCEDKGYYYYWLSLLEATNDSLDNKEYSKKFINDYKNSFWINDYLLWLSVIKNYGYKEELNLAFKAYLFYNKDQFKIYYNKLSNVSLEYKILLSFLLERFEKVNFNLNSLDLWYSSLKDFSNGKFLILMVENFFDKTQLKDFYNKILLQENDSTWREFIENRILQYNN